MGGADLTLGILLTFGLVVNPLAASAAPAGALADAPAVAPLAGDPSWGSSGGWKDLVRGLLQPRGARAAFQRLQGLGREALPAVRSMLRGRNLRLVRAALDLADDLGEDIGDRLDQAGGLGAGLTQDLRAIVADRRLGGLRRRAARLLGRVNAPLEQVLPALSAALRDPDLRLRLTAADSLLAWWARREGLWPEVRAVLRQPGHPVRIVLAEILGRAGPLAHPLGPLVTTWVRTGHVEPAAVITSLLPRFLPGARDLSRLALPAWEHAPAVASPAVAAVPPPVPPGLIPPTVTSAASETSAGPALPAATALPATVAAPIGPVDHPSQPSTAINPFSPAIDLPDAEADEQADPEAAAALRAAATQADQALSFEDVPAGAGDYGPHPGE